MEDAYRLYAPPYGQRRHGSARVSGAFSRTAVFQIMPFSLSEVRYFTNSDQEVL